MRGEEIATSAKDIFPPQVMENTVYDHFNRHYSHSQRLYLFILVFILCCFATLFLVKVPISIRSGGILTSINERSALRAPASGIVAAVSMKENQQVKRGEQLLTLQTGLADEQEKFISFRKQELSNEMSDLNQLINMYTSRDAHRSMALRSPKYRGQLELFRHQLEEADLQHENANKTYDRYKKLHVNSVISDAEFERFQYELRQAKQKINGLYEQYMSNWYDELNRIRLELKDFSLRGREYQEGRKLLTLQAPEDGVIQQFTGIAEKSVVTAGEILAELSPDSGLIARIHVRPADIGLIHEGMAVAFRVDAFDYNIWGGVQGIVSDVSGDVIMMDGQPVFTVRCVLDSDTLALKNGYIGTLKKGMTLQASFRIAERTLFQLLYDKVDDWINPAVTSSNNS